MNPLFDVEIEGYNLIQIAHWIKDCRLSVTIEDRATYVENPQRYYEDISAFCDEYKAFFEKNKDFMTGKLFQQALKLSVMPAPRYVLETKDTVEIDVSAEVEQMQLQNLLSSPAIAKSIDREGERVKRYADKIAPFVSGKREALYAAINYLLFETVTYKVLVPEKAGSLKGKDIKAVIRDIKRGKWQVVEHTLKPTNGTISDYLFCDLRVCDINKNIFYSFVKSKEESKKRIYGKQFLYNIGFYLGLSASEMEQVLRNEGHTMQLSLRPDDQIMYQSFYYSIGKRYASALLRKAGYDGLEIGNS